MNAKLWSILIIGSLAFILSFVLLPSPFNAVFGYMLGGIEGTLYAIEVERLKRIGEIE